MIYKAILTWLFSRRRIFSRTRQLAGLKTDTWWCIDRLIEHLQVQRWVSRVVKYKHASRTEIGKLTDA